MARVTIEMDMNCDGFDETSIEEKFQAVQEIINTGAEATNMDIMFRCIRFVNEDGNTTTENIGYEVEHKFGIEEEE